MQSPCSCPSPAAHAAPCPASAAPCLAQPAPAPRATMATNEPAPHPPPVAAQAGWPQLSAGGEVQAWRLLCAKPARCRPSPPTCTLFTRSSMSCLSVAPSFLPMAIILPMRMVWERMAVKALIISATCCSVLPLPSAMRRRLLGLLISSSGASFSSGVMLQQADRQAGRQARSPRGSAACPRLPLPTLHQCRHTAAVQALCGWPACGQSTQGQ